MSFFVYKCNNQLWHVIILDNMFRLKFDASFASGWDGDTHHRVI